MDSLSPWQGIIPDSLLLEIFGYLDLVGLGRAVTVCTSWKRVATDPFLWRSLAQRMWNIKGSLAPGKSCWREEVKRLTYHVPLHESECLVKHTDEVLDVSISHNGKYFCTTSKDKLVVLWQLDFPSCVVAEVNTGTMLKWEFTQYSCFNDDDSLVFVCGWRSLTPNQLYMNGTTGCGAVFTVPDMKLVSLGELDPPTLFGSWLTNRIFVGGGTSDVNETIKIQAYKVTDEAIENPLCTKIKEGEDIQYDRHAATLFKFNGNRYHQLNLLVATVPQDDIFTSTPCESSMTKITTRCPICRKLCSQTAIEEGSAEEIEESSSLTQTITVNMTQTSCTCINNISSKHSGEEHLEMGNSLKSRITGRDIKRQKGEKHYYKCETSEKTLTKPGCKTYILFSTGNHDTIGVHEVSEEKLTEISQTFNDLENEHYVASDPGLDIFDHRFFIGDCYITGLCLSQDNRYVYCNYRETDEKTTGHSIEDKIFSEDIKTGVLDLVSMTILKDIVYQGHVGYSSYPAWYICVDASNDYIGSGSEDHKGYLWDRHYNALLANLPHSCGVINGIAFSPTDQETCITVCDDKTVKVWRSKNNMKIM